MTRIDFYVLPSNSTNERYRYVCRLTEKLYRLGRTVLIATDSSMQNKILDDLLWTFRAGSFVPHEIKTNQNAHPEVPVVLACTEEWSDYHDLIINLSTEIPNGFDRFNRLAEVIDQNVEARAAGRIRYRRYKEKGYEIFTHKIDSIR